MGYKKLNLKEKAKIFYQYSCGLSRHNVSLNLKIPENQISEWIKKWKINRNLSESHKGQHSSPATQFVKGQPAWNKGKVRYWKAPSFPKGNVSWLKGKKIQTNTGRTHFKKGHKLGLGKPAPWAKGENNVNWKGGISDKNRLIRESDQYKQWRRDVFVRDQFTC